MEENQAQITLENKNNKCCIFNYSLLYNEVIIMGGTKTISIYLKRIKFRIYEEEVLDHYYKEALVFYDKEGDKVTFQYTFGGITHE